MPKLYSSDFLIKVLLAKGFVFISQRGSHIKLRNLSISPTRTVIIPSGRKEIPLGTLKSILRQSGLDEDELVSL